MALSLTLLTALTTAAPYQQHVSHNASAPAAATWKIENANPGSLTFSIGVGFSDENKGVLAGGANNVGAEVLKSEDGGKTFTVIEGINFGLDILLLAAESAKDTIIITSVFGELYSLDGGKTFRLSIGGGMSQSVRYIGGIGNGDGLHFGIAGQHSGKQALGVTKNGGVTFQSFPAPVTTLARYGAFPSENVFYMAAGEFPSAPPPPPPAKGSGVRRARISELMNEDGTWNINAPQTPRSKSGDGYAAQIAKTEDGGRTWDIQFSLNGSFYFNEIDCAPGNENLCCAAAESSGSATPGVYILCTSDGKEWSQKYNKPSDGSHSYTLMGLEFTGKLEAWAVGGQIGLFTKPMFLHTTDGGSTWTEEAVGEDLAGGIVLGLDMVSPTVGFAAIDNVAKQQAGLAKYSA